MCCRRLPYDADVTFHATVDGIVAQVLQRIQSIAAAADEVTQVFAGQLNHVGIILGLPGVRHSLGIHMLQQSLQENFDLLFHAAGLGRCVDLIFLGCGFLLGHELAHELHKQEHAQSDDQEVDDVLDEGAIVERANAGFLGGVDAHILLAVQSNEQTAQVYAAGYKTDATEFIDPEDTPKNIMLRAHRRKNWRDDSREAAEKRERYRAAYFFMYGKYPD